MCEAADRDEMPMGGVGQQDVGVLGWAGMRKDDERKRERNWQNHVYLCVGKLNSNRIEGPFMG